VYLQPTVTDILYSRAQRIEEYCGCAVC